MSRVTNNFFLLLFSPKKEKEKEKIEIHYLLQLKPALPPRQKAFRIPQFLNLS